MAPKAKKAAPTVAKARAKSKVKCKIAALVGSSSIGSSSCKLEWPRNYSTITP